MDEKILVQERRRRSSLQDFVEKDTGYVAHWEPEYQAENVVPPNKQPHITFVSRGTRTSMAGICKDQFTIRKTKIVATLGPSCWSEDTIGKMIDAGLNIARFNFSHGTHEGHLEVLERFRKVSAQKFVNAAVMLDTLGPEIRSSNLRDHEPIILVEGQEIIIEAIGRDYLTWEGYKDEKETRIGLSYDRLCQSLSVGGRIVLQDGQIGVQVTEIVSDKVLKGKVLNTKELGERKTCNLPGVAPDIPVLTEKDIADVKFCAMHKMDYVAASFVQSGEDVDFIRRTLDEAGGTSVRIISKVESHKGLENIDQIIAKSDGIMVARGDLGTEIPSEKVALAQKMIVAKCNIAGKFVIVAREMLESMCSNPLPTRAEMTDVANAVFDGADSVCLSSETANGAYPVQVVETMASITENAELGLDYASQFLFIRFWNYHTRAIGPQEATLMSAAKSAVEFSEDVDGDGVIDANEGALIIVITANGTAANLVSKYRPTGMIIVVTASEEVARRCSGWFGQDAFLVSSLDKDQHGQPMTVDDLLGHAVAYATKKGYVVPGKKIIYVSGATEASADDNAFVFLPETKAAPQAQRGRKRRNSVFESQAKLPYVKSLIATAIDRSLLSSLPNHTRCTKIIATLGPACWSEEMMVKLLDAGLNIARFNFSHGTHEGHLEVLERFRKICSEKRNPAAVMLDTRGPEIRTAMLRNHEPIMLVKGQDIFIEAVGAEYLTWEGFKTDDETRIGISYAKLCQHVDIGSKLILQDGQIGLEVIEMVSDKVLKCKVLNSKEFGERKSVNLPGVQHDIPVLTEKDVDDVKNFCAKHKMDYLAASFVQSGEDVDFIRRTLDEAGAKDCKIISKIENQAGLQNLSEIIAKSDGIMVARGDLGTEIPAEKVALAQKMIITKCNIAGKFVIVARQMLISMESCPWPTRAEMTDVANAVFDGADCVMLSGETANGQFPEEAVKAMAAMAANAEVGINRLEVYSFIRNNTSKPMSYRETICSSAVQSSYDMGACLLTVFTNEMHPARLLAKWRPQVPIIVVTTDEQLVRHCSGHYGLVPMKVDTITTVQEMMPAVADFARSLGLADLQAGDDESDQIIVINGIDMQMKMFWLEMSAYIFGDEKAQLVKPSAYEGAHTYTQKSTKVGLDLVCKPIFSVRKTKIICTMGPKCWGEEMLAKLMDEGLNIARFNFSHGSHEGHLEVLERFRKVRDEKKSAAAVLLDTKGPEIRTAMLKNHTPIKLSKNQEIFVEAVGDDYVTWEGYKDEKETRIGLSYAKLCQSLNVGGRILLADGSVVIEVLEIVSERLLRGKVLNDKELGERKNCNLPGVQVDIPVLTDKDINDVQNFCAKHKMDYIAASFVQSGEDVRFIRRTLDTAGGQSVQIISKIENEAGLRNIDDIIAESDGIMVARGDLGMEIPSEKVALAQKMIITKCNVAGKFVITATQMLESMCGNPLPTRAEMTDVANAVFDGTDCVMLSGETANGAFPDGAVATMAAIVKDAEVGINYFQVGCFLRDFTPKPMGTVEAMLCCAAKNAVDITAGLIVVFSENGLAPRLIAKYRPSVPVVVVTSSNDVRRHCNSVFSLRPYKIDKRIADPAEAKVVVQKVLDESVADGTCPSGAIAIVIQGVTSVSADEQPRMILQAVGGELPQNFLVKQQLFHPSFDSKATVSLRSNAISLDEVCSDYAPVRKTKIICTMGPKCWGEEMLAKLMDEGLNIARFNFSHGSHEGHLEVLERFRKVRDEKKSAAAVLLDTKGPEIRTAMLKNHTPIKLSKNQEIFVEAVGDDYVTWEGYKDEKETRIGLSYAKLCQSLNVGGRILLADGSVVIEVLEIVSERLLRGKVLNDKELGERKNCNLPGVQVDIPVLTDKDINDVQNFCAKHKMDYIAASFVQSGEDVRFIRRTLDAAGGQDVQIISKIENEAGLTNIDAIIKESDGIMVARGDLGMEIPSEKVALAQKMIITKCNVAGKFVITATQMLESMCGNPLPTRAEMTDVANAVFDGTDCVMLSGETANGAFPDGAVSAMAAIVRNAELVNNFYSYFSFIRDFTPKPISEKESMASSAARSCIDCHAVLCIVVTDDGMSAALVTKYRPDVPVLVVTTNVAVAKHTQGRFGQYPCLVESTENNFAPGGSIEVALAYAKEQNLVRKEGGRVVVCAKTLSHNISISSTQI